jgi:hypothetical protein
MLKESPMKIHYERDRLPAATFTSGNLFLLGKTKSGKSLLAERLIGERADLVRRLSASEWIRTMTRDQPEGQDHMAYVAFLTAESEKRLRADPLAAVRYMTDFQGMRSAPNWAGSIVDGMRNPCDFVHLFRPGRDFALFLSNPAHELDGPFDDGVELIRDYVLWLSRHLSFSAYDRAILA